MCAAAGPHQLRPGPGVCCPRHQHTLAQHSMLLNFLRERGKNLVLWLQAQHPFENKVGLPPWGSSPHKSAVAAVVLSPTGPGLCTLFLCSPQLAGAWWVLDLWLSLGKTQSIDKVVNVPSTQKCWEWNWGVVDAGEGEAVLQVRKQWWARPFTHGWSCPHLLPPHAGVGWEDARISHFKLTWKLFHRDDF